METPAAAGPSLDPAASADGSLPGGSPDDMAAAVAQYETQPEHVRRQIDLIMDDASLTDEEKVARIQPFFSAEETTVATPVPDSAGGSRKGRAKGKAKGKGGRK